MAAAVAILRQLNEAAEKRCILEVTDKEPISRISISAEKNWTIFFTHFFFKVARAGERAPVSFVFVYFLIPSLFRRATAAPLYSHIFDKFFLPENNR
jgi:hypothetical protein